MIKNLIKIFIFRFFKIVCYGINTSHKTKLSQPKEEQAKILKMIFKKYKKTKYFRSKITNKKPTLSNFQKQIPITQYEKIKNDILKDHPNYQNNLLPSKIIKVEYTSGSSGHKKLIPYTKNALKDFQMAFLYWACDLIINYKGFKTGSIFYSISPSISKNELQDDMDYLSPMAHFFLKDHLINRQDILKITNCDVFQLALALTLLQHEELEILFLWSPSYLTTILSTIKKNRTKIFKIMLENQFKSEDIIIEFNFSKERAQSIKDNWNDFNNIWPNLKFLSCWTEGSSNIFLANIQKIFPHLYIQGKGLIATEAVYTIPLFHAKGCIPLVSRNFYEFKDGNNEISLLHELKIDHTYSIIISNLSGLLRYEIGDLVKVSHFYQGSPVLSFIGKKDFEVSLTGEKLSESLVQKCLEPLLKNYQMAFIYPSLEISPHYICITDSTHPDFELNLEKELIKIFHYHESRRLGQLQKIKVIKVKDCQKIYYEYFLSKGLRLGDIKNYYLLNKFHYDFTSE